MDNNDAKRRWRGGGTALGGLLLLLGILVLAGQAVDVDVGQVGWPFFVIVPGLGLLGLGLATDGRLGEVLAMVGGVVSVNGLVLLVQNATDRFDTWAYAWTLVFVVGPGIGRWLVGVVRGRGELAASGAWLVGVGLAAFLVLMVVFEVVVGVDGRGFGAAGRYGLAALLILAGRSTRRVVAATVPPVASTSSTSSTRAPRSQRVTVHLEGGLAVLERVGLGVRLARQLAGLAHRHEARRRARGRPARPG